MSCQAEQKVILVFAPGCRLQTNKYVLFLTHTLLCIGAVCPLLLCLRLSVSITSDCCINILSLFLYTQAHTIVTLIWLRIYLHTLSWS